MVRQQGGDRKEQYTTPFSFVWKIQGRQGKRLILLFFVRHWTDEKKARHGGYNRTNYKGTKRRQSIIWHLFRSCTALGERRQGQTRERKKERYGGTLQGKRIGGWEVPAADVQLDKGEVYFSLRYCLVYNAVSFFFGYKPFLHPWTPGLTLVFVCVWGGTGGGVWARYANDARTYRT